MLVSLFSACEKRTPETEGTAATTAAETTEAATPGRHHAEVRTQIFDFPYLRSPRLLYAGVVHGVRNLQEYGADPAGTYNSRWTTPSPPIPPPMRPPLNSYIAATTLTDVFYPDICPRCGQHLRGYGPVRKHGGRACLFRRQRLRHVRRRRHFTSSRA